MKLIYDFKIICEERNAFTFFEVYISSYDGQGVSFKLI